MKCDQSMKQAEFFVKSAIRGQEWDRGTVLLSQKMTMLPRRNVLSVQASTADPRRGGDVPPASRYQSLLLFDRR